MTMPATTITPRGNNSCRCPVCQGLCRTLKTRDITETYREITFLCTNEACGHIFVASLTPVRTLSESSLRTSCQDGTTGATPRGQPC